MYIYYGCYIKSLPTAVSVVSFVFALYNFLYVCSFIYLFTKL